MKFLLLATASIFLIGCKTKSNESTTKLIKSINVSKEEPFESFIKKFSCDSTFQNNHIKFPILLIAEDDSGESEQSYIEQKDWGFSDLTKLKKPKYIQTLKKISSLEYLLIFQIEDTGVYIIYTFRKQENGWILIKITDAGD